MEKIYEEWVEDFGVDGSGLILRVARGYGVLDQPATALTRCCRAGPEELLHVRRGLLRRHVDHLPQPKRPRAHVDGLLTSSSRNVTLDASRRSAAGSALVFGDDYKYTTDKANAYEQVTFLGNHDMGRIGYFLNQDNPKATDAELVKKDELANELMFSEPRQPGRLLRDEQGFTGAGGDKDARQTMFASKVADYHDDEPHDRTHASDAYDTSAPLYKEIAALSKLRKDNPALADGVQTERRAQWRRLRLLPYGRQQDRVPRRPQQRGRGEDGDLRDRLRRHDLPGDLRDLVPADERRRQERHRHRPGGLPPSSSRRPARSAPPPRSPRSP